MRNENFKSQEGELEDTSGFGGDTNKNSYWWRKWNFGLFVKQEEGGHIKQIGEGI